ncbi:hypothetical protein BBJ28_00005990 [Nothophytophthora sp. Chile5]|nr:hypothetical protein BBJ28_00005990 [Nothophytophthora sp. Chile5]
MYSAGGFSVAVTGAARAPAVVAVVAPLVVVAAVDVPKEPNAEVGAALVSVLHSPPAEVVVAAAPKENPPVDAAGAGALVVAAAPALGASTKNPEAVGLASSPVLAALLASVEVVVAAEVPLPAPKLNPPVEAGAAADAVILASAVDAPPKLNPEEAAGLASAVGGAPNPKPDEEAAGFASAALVVVPAADVSFDAKENAGAAPALAPEVPLAAAGAPNAKPEAEGGALVFASAVAGAAGVDVAPKLKPEAPPPLVADVGAVELAPKPKPPDGAVLAEAAGAAAPKEKPPVGAALEPVLLLLAPKLNPPLAGAAVPAPVDPEPNAKPLPPEAAPPPLDCPKLNDILVSILWTNKEDERREDERQPEHARGRDYQCVCIESASIHVHPDAEASKPQIFGVWDGSMPLVGLDDASFDLNDLAAKNRNRGNYRCSKAELDEDMTTRVLDLSLQVRYQRGMGNMLQRVGSPPCA